jgi:hypothetical protein
MSITHSRQILFEGWHIRTRPDTDFKGPLHSGQPIESSGCDLRCSCGAFYHLQKTKKPLQGYGVLGTAVYGGGEDRNRESRKNPHQPVTCSRMAKPPGFHD